MVVHLRNTVTSTTIPAFLAEEHPRQAPVRAVWRSTGGSAKELRQGTGRAAPVPVTVRHGLRLATVALRVRADGWAGASARTTATIPLGLLLLGPLFGDEVEVSAKDPSGHYRASRRRPEPAGDCFVPLFLVDPYDHHDRGDEDGGRPCRNAYHQDEDFDSCHGGSPFRPDQRPLFISDLPLSAVGWSASQRVSGRLVGRVTLDPRFIPLVSTLLTNLSYHTNVSTIMLVERSGDCNT
jgi:hypothetical protein